VTTTYVGSHCQRRAPFQKIKNMPIVVDRSRWIQVRQGAAWGRFPTNPTLTVTVVVNDNTVGDTPDDTADLTISITTPVVLTITCRWLCGTTCRSTEYSRRRGPGEKEGENRNNEAGRSPSFIVFVKVNSTQPITFPK